MTTGENPVSSQALLEEVYTHLKAIAQIHPANYDQDEAFACYDEILAATPDNPLAPKQPHHAPKAKRVIYLFQAGGPAQVDLFDHKPALEKFHGQDIF